MRFKLEKTVDGGTALKRVETQGNDTMTNVATAVLESATNSFYENDVDHNETRKVMVYADISSGGVLVDVRYENDSFGGLCIGELGQVDGKNIADCL